MDDISLKLSKKWTKVDKKIFKKRFQNFFKVRVLKNNFSKTFTSTHYVKYKMSGNKQHKVYSSFFPNLSKINATS